MDADNGKRKPVLGCDIGNAYAYASVLENMEQDPVSLMDKLREGMPTTAFVPADPAEPIRVFDLRLGAPERDMNRWPKQVIGAIKRHFSQNTIPLEGVERSVSPEEAYAAVVRDLVILANEQRSQLRQEKIYDLVFTYPVSFIGNTQVRERMKNSIESVELDGHKLHVVSSLPEPGAVALDYLYYMQHIQKLFQDRDRLVALVVDLGHGTLDLAVVTAYSQTSPDREPYEVHSYGSLGDVGGMDFDEVLVDIIRDKLQGECGFARLNANQENQVRREAKRVKHALSEKDRVELELSFIEELDQTVAVTREEFEAGSAPLLGRILEKVEDVLNEAEGGGVHIDAVVPSGGASQMPMIRRGLEDLTRHKYPIEPYRPSMAVSFGAARYAWGVTEKSVSRVENTQTAVSDTGTGNTLLGQKASYSYGLRYFDKRAGEYRVEYLIPYQAKLPAQKSLEWISDSIDLDVDIRRSRKNEKTARTAPLAETDDMSNRTLHGVPVNQRYQVTMLVDDQHHVKVTVRFADGTEFRHGTGKYRQA